MNARAKGNWQGMNWIRQEKRLAIYLRDGCACAWCGTRLEDGVVLSLDHFIPHSEGGSNEASNLVTSCKRCNDSRGARSALKFARAVAQYLDSGIEAAAILKHVRECMQRALPLSEAKELIARRGSAFEALKERA